eukprot:Em0021g57a
MVILRKGQIQLVDDEEQEHWVSASDAKRIKPMHPTSADGVEDMIRLGDLHEAGILHNLLIRYKKQMIYTFTGSILVAINPYQLLPIYDSTYIQQYKDKKIGEEPPHIFSIADNAYYFMKRELRNICVIISGESGAGKTESTKLILQFLAAVSGQHSWIEQQILEANPIMEAFGNAKTKRNDNSSRFGKYIDVHFSTKGIIQGANIEQYLLEKSRIVNQGDCVECDCTYDQDNRPIGDKEHFAVIRGAMKVLNFTEEEMGNIWQLVATVMHLGNLIFKETEKANLPVAHIGNKDGTTLAAAMLQVPAEGLEQALCNKSTVTRGEVVVSPISGSAAQDVCDAFVKGIYGRVFVWIVQKINKTIYKPPEDKKDKRLSIGVLDIFGFESFQINSFEQLCINFCNENLQQFFVHHIFKLEQAEYDKERIQWEHIEFKDNQEILDILSAKPLNIISLVDEESKFPKGTDLSMLQKLHNQHGTNPHYVMPKSSIVHEFGIVHFAGTVSYQAKGFLDKNRDTFSNDLFDLLSKSRSPFLLEIFKNDRTMTAETRKKSPTLALQFKKSLDELMLTLSQCQPFFVRCIKPNEHKEALTFDRELCTRQLRYSGMRETIRIRRAGYPIRHTFKEFVERYYVLQPGMIVAQVPDMKLAAKTLCTKVLGGHDWQIGNTKVFIKDADDLLLEELRDVALTTRVVLIQRWVRGFFQRRRFLRMRRAALVLQKNYRRHYAARRYKITVKRLEAEKLRKEEEERLKKQMRGEEARKEAERLHKERLAKIEQEQAEEAERIRNEAKRKRSEVIRMEEAAKNRLAEADKPVDDSKIVDQMFGFLPGREGVEPQGEVIGKVHTSEVEAEDLSQYKFAKFAATYFQGAATHNYIKRALRQPLLALKSEQDVQQAFVPLPAGQCASRPRAGCFGHMGHDSSGSLGICLNPKRPQLPQKAKENLGSGLKKKLYGTIKEGSLPRGEERRKESLRKRIASMTLKKKSKLSPDVVGAIEGGEDSAMTLQKTTTNLEKLHFIIGYGILKPELRDEIYCQICKQLIQNPVKDIPRQGLIKYIRCFISEGPPGYAPYCEERLCRTQVNGCRHQPPSWLELQATKSKKPLMLPITFMDGNTKTLLADSATTAKELCVELAEKIGLKDSFGFSLYIALFDKVSSLGSGGDHVMDAISQCEQYAKEMGAQERNAPWRLFFRKEIFAPWHTPSEDPVGTNLIYQQIVRGIKFGEYRCDRNEDMAALAGQQYYIEFGTELSQERLVALLPVSIPDSLLAPAGAQDKWVQMIATVFAKVRDGASCGPINSSVEVWCGGAVWRCGVEVWCGAQEIEEWIAEEKMEWIAQEKMEEWIAQEEIKAVRSF